MGSEPGMRRPVTAAAARTEAARTLLVEATLIMTVLRVAARTSTPTEAAPRIQTEPETMSRHAHARTLTLVAPPIRSIGAPAPTPAAQTGPTRDGRAMANRRIDALDRNPKVRIAPTPDGLEARVQTIAVPTPAAASTGPVLVQTAGDSAATAFPRVLVEPAKPATLARHRAVTARP